MPNTGPPDLTGQVFGRLRVVRLEAIRNRAAYWMCECECGVRVVRRASHLRGGRARSCGCAGYRHDPERHAIARAKVSERKRQSVAQLGGVAARRARDLRTRPGSANTPEPGQ